MHRSDRKKECADNNSTLWEDGNYFTRYDYHSSMGSGVPCELINAEDSSIPVARYRLTSTIDLMDAMSEMEGKGKCDRNIFKANAEAQTCGSNGPLSFKYPFVDRKRCDMTFDCPYEPIGVGPSQVDEGAWCMEHCMLTKCTNSY